MADLTIDTTSLSVPAGFSVGLEPDSIVAPTDWTMITIQLDADQLGSYSGELSFTNNDGDEGLYNFTITGVVVDPEPEIDVYDEYELIEDEYGYVDVGQTITGTPIEYTFTVTNVGGADLTLDPATLALPVGFSLVSAFGSTVEPLDSTEFTVQLDAAAAGYYSGEVSFTNDDSDEDPFNFTISGDVVDPPLCRWISTLTTVPACPARITTPNGTRVKGPLPVKT